MTRKIIYSTIACLMLLGALWAPHTPAKAHHKQCNNTVSHSVITREKAKVAAPEQHHYITPERVQFFAEVFTRVTNVPWSDEGETELYIIRLNDGALIVAFHQECLLGYLKLPAVVWNKMLASLESV